MLRCVNQSPPIALDSVAPDRRGIEECITLVEELQKAKKVVHTKPIDSGVAAGDDAGAAASGGDTASGGDIASGGVSVDVLTLNDEKDPCVEEARGHTLEAASRLERFEKLDDLITRLLSNFKSTERVMILVDAPTSKVRVNHDLLDKAAQIFTRLIPLTAPEDRAVLAVCGQRVSLLSAIANKFDTATLTPQHYSQSFKLRI